MVRPGAAFVLLGIYVGNSQMTAFEIDRNAQGASLETRLDGYEESQPRAEWR